MINSRNVFIRTALMLAIIAITLGCQSQSTNNEPEAKPMTIENVAWQLSEIQGTPAEPVPADSQAPYLKLSATDKRASGYTGINSFNGNYELKGQSMRFGPMIMTRRAGPEPLMKQESAFTQALNTTASWRGVSHDSIQLLDAQGSPLATFTRSAAP